MGNSYGLKTQMHCCGGVYELIPGMIDAGIDGLHAVQTSCRGMGLARLKLEFGDTIIFNGGIDSHHTLMEKDAAHQLNIKCVQAKRPARRFPTVGKGFRQQVIKLFTFA